MAITAEEVAETLNMVTEQHLDIRTITMGINLMGCADSNLDRMCTKVYDHITKTAENLVPVAESLEREYGIRDAHRADSRGLSRCGPRPARPRA